MTSADLAAHHRGFRTSYLDHDAIVAQLRSWQDAYPALVRVEVLARTPEGRDILLATIGPDPDRARPSVWIDGNMHASELCGSSVALAIAEDVLRLHLDPASAIHGLSKSACDTLREVLFCVVPRISPDGAERVLKRGQYVRSVARDDDTVTGRPKWVPEDVDGDGLALVMRVEDETGEFCESKEHPGLLVIRSLEDDGPFYKLYPEGRIEHFDGHTIPTPTFLDSGSTDLNRNFPHGWAAEPKQVGAGRYPTSEPESRAIVEAAVARPHLFAWLNLHTFGGVFIRPLGDAPDTKMDPSDLAIFRQIEEWGTTITGYPTVSGFEEFTYEPDTPIYGDLSEWAYHDRGAIAYVCELWNLFDELGFPRPKKFVERYTRLSRADNERLAKWDREKNAGRIVRPWKRFDHPQLGPVEIGGIDPRVGITNPPFERLDEICNAQSSMFLRVASMAPRVRAGAVEVRATGDLTTLAIPIENVGYLPTYVLSSAKKLPWNAPIYADVAGDGCEIDPSDRHVEIGHLDGWGRGLFDGSGALYYSRSRGSTGRAILRVRARGRGVVKIRLRSPRIGTIELAPIAVGGG
jgi:hypothetical protein